jgi:amino acid transporter
MAHEPPLELPPALRRRLGLPLLVLYGVGITIGAGIYVLIGAVAGHAGRYAPWSFLLAGLAMALTVGSYAELSTRFPVSAGEAAYVRATFQSRFLSTLTGLITILIGVISSATASIGAANYIRQFVDWPRGVIVVLVLAALGLVAGWGILESVLLASLFTLIEVGGLVIIIVAGFKAGVPIASQWPCRRSMAPCFPALPMPPCSLSLPLSVSRISPTLSKKPRYRIATSRARWCSRLLSPPRFISRWRRSR